MSSKHFNKLRFGTSKIQPELKCLETILQVLMNPFLRANLSEDEFDSGNCQLNFIHFHCAKIARLSLQFIKRILCTHMNILLTLVAEYAGWNPLNSGVLRSSLTLT